MSKPTKKEIMLKVTAFLTSSEHYSRRQLKSRCVQRHEQDTGDIGGSVEES